MKWIRKDCTSSTTLNWLCTPKRHSWQSEEDCQLLRNFETPPVSIFFQLFIFAAGRSSQHRLISLFACRRFPSAASGHQKACCTSTGPRSRRRSCAASESAEENGGPPPFGQGTPCPVLSAGRFDETIDGQVDDKDADKIDVRVLCQEEEDGSGHVVQQNCFVLIRSSPRRRQRRRTRRLVRLLSNISCCRSSLLRRRTKSSRIWIVLTDDENFKSFGVLKRRWKRRSTI